MAQANCRRSGRRPSLGNGLDQVHAAEAELRVAAGGAEVVDGGVELGADLGLAENDGFLAAISAATPATCGVAIEVPENAT